MKKYYLLFVLCTLFFTSKSKAQKVLNEVYLKYTVALVADKNPSYAKAFEGASLSIYIKGGFSRTEMYNNLGNEISLFDNNTGKGAILKEYSGQKLMIYLSRVNWAEKNKHFQQLKLSATKDQQLINGYNCKKSIATLDDGDRLVVYFSPDYTLNNKQYNYAFPDINGLPIRFELESSGMKFVYTLKDISYDIIPVSKFNIPTSGNYRILNYDEAKKIKSIE